MLGKIIWSLLIAASGFGLLVYTEPVKRFTGPIDFAEKYFGAGGTYTFFKLVGLGLIIGALFWVTGTIDRLIPDFLLAR